MSASPAPAPRCPSLNPPNLYYLIWQKRFFLLMWFWLRIWTWEIIPGCLGGLSLITWVLKSERQQSEWVGDLDKARRGQGELKPLPLLLALKRAGRGPCVRDLWATSRSGDRLQLRASKGMETSALPMARNRIPPTTRMNTEIDSLLETPERMQPCTHVDCNLVRPISDLTSRMVRK